MLSFSVGAVPNSTHWGALLSHPDIRRSELPLSLSQEDLHGPVEQVHPQLPLPLQLPRGHHPVVVPSLLVGQHLQPCNGKVYLVEAVYLISLHSF